MTLSKHLLAMAMAPLLALGLAACGDSDKEPSPSSSAPGATAAQATREVELLKSARPTIGKLTDALRRGDLAASKQAYEAYDAAWNGIEVYVNFRDRALYGDLETGLQAKIADGLAASPPNLAALVPVSEALGKKYDQAIALVQKSASLSPLFDDLATLRIVRSDLRIATSALTASDVARARTYFTTFKGNYPKTQALIKVRSASVEGDISAAIAAADARFQANGALDELKPLVAAVTDRYNYAVNLLNAAARNADLTKKAITEEDKKYLSSLNDLKNQLRRSLDAWRAGDYAGAATAAAAASAAFSAVQPALAARSNDAALKTALDAYAALAGTGGDAAKAAAANNSAIEAGGVAEQALAGQFWADPGFQSFLATLPKA